MSEWKETELAELTVKIGSGATPRGGSNSYKDEGISLIRSQNVLDLQFSKTGLAFIDNIQADALKNVTIELNDILLNITGDSVARACKVPDNILPARVNQHVAIIRVDNDKLSPNFLLYNLIAQKEELLSQSEIGATRKAITKGMIEKFQIKLPPLPEQKAIAEVLSSLDDKIDLLHRQNKTLEEMAETLFRQWFVPARAGEPQAGGEEAKEDWEEMPLSRIATHLKKPVKPENNPTIQYFHYSIPSFDNGKRAIVELGNDIKSNKYEVPKNCILFSKLNPHKDKRVWLLQDEVMTNSICSTEFQVIYPKESSYLYFIYGWLTLNENYREIASGVGGTSGSHQRISPSEIFDFPIIIYPKILIEKYNLQAKPLYEKQLNNQQQIRTLEKLRDTLLPKLMSGEVRVKF